MAKVKLDLQNKDFLQLEKFATDHSKAMAGNANYTTPSPAAAVFDAALADYAGKNAEIVTAEMDLQTKRAERVALRAALEKELNSRGVYVQEVSGGDEAKILSAGFDVQAAATPTTSIAVPSNVTASMGDNPGEIDVGCNAVSKAKSYLIEYRQHSETSAPGNWTLAKVASRSSATLSGMESGRKYAFRMRALGPNDLESPWSDEAVCMAP